MPCLSPDQATSKVVLAELFVISMVTMLSARCFSFLFAPAKVGQVAKKKQKKSPISNDGPKSDCSLIKFLYFCRE